MKKILFSPHPNFLSIIKKHFSDKEKYLILGVQDHFVRSLNDMDVQNVETFIGNNEIQTQAYDYASRIIKQNKSLTKEQKNNIIFAKFLKKVNSLAYAKLYDLIVFLLLLDDKRPDLVVLHNDVEPFMRMIAMWAKNNNIPCLHIPHSVIIDSSEKTSIGTDIHDIVTASDIVVGGDYQKEWYKTRGVEDSNIHQTGLPQFDNIVSMSYDREKALRLLRLPTNEPVITYASSWRQDTNLLGCHDGIEQTYINFLKASKKLGIKPIIKLHPNSSQGNVDWHTMTAKKMDIYAILSTAHLHTVLQASNILFSYGPSNVLLEGSFYPMQLMTTHGYDDDDAILKVGNEATEDEIANGIANLLQNDISDLSALRYKYIGVVDGKAHQRIADTINRLLNGS